MIARFPGKCAAAGDAVMVGDTIVKDGYGWSHPDHVTPAMARSNAARRPYAFADGEPDMIGAAEAFEAERDRARDDAEYAAGIEDAKRERFNRDMFGESYAAAEEYARDMRGLNGEW